MKVKSNFSYIIGTELEIFYEDLKRCEEAIGVYSIFINIMARKIAEQLAKKIYNKKIDANNRKKNFATYIKALEKLDIDSKITEDFNIIRENGNRAAHYDIPEIKSYTDVEILEKLHHLLIWYLKDVVKQINKNTKIIFKLTTSLKEELEEVDKIKKVLEIKNKEIDELKENTANLKLEYDSIGNNTKKVEELEGKLNAIILERNSLILKEKKLETVIKNHRENLERTKELSDKERKKVIRLQLERNMAQSAFIEKEKQFSVLESKNTKLLNEIENLRNKDIYLEKKVKDTENELENLRRSYEKSFILSKKLQDIIEKGKYTYLAEEELIVQKKKGEIKEKIHIEDTEFNNYSESFEREVEETEKRSKNLNSFLELKEIKNVKYVEFYKSFLNITGHELRIFYVILNKLNLTEIIISKAKDMLSINENQKMIEYINNKAKKYASISDVELRLEIYYKLIQYSNITLSEGFSEKEFKRGLDSIVDVAYNTLSKEESFNHNGRKIEAICSYYLISFFEDLATNNTNILNNNSTMNIYNTYGMLSKKQQNKVVESMGIELYSREDIISEINLEPTKFLLSIIKSVGEDSYMKAINLLYMNINSSKFNAMIQSCTNLNSIAGIIVENIINGIIMNKRNNYKINMVPVLVMQILVSSSSVGDSSNYTSQINQMKNLWYQKQKVYKEYLLFNKKNLSELDKKTAEKEALLNKKEKVIIAKRTLEKQLNEFEIDFKEIVIESKKINKLNSYNEYIKLKNEKEEYATKKNRVIKEVGILKSIFKKKRWENQGKATKVYFEMISKENQLIEEAKIDSNFIEEYRPFKEISKNIESINKLDADIMSELDKNDIEISNLKEKLNTIDTNIKKLSNIYPDISLSIE